MVKPIIYDLRKKIKKLEEENKELKKSKEICNENISKFHSLFKDISVGYLSLDKEDRVIDVNNKWSEEFGYMPDDVIGSFLIDFLTPDSKEKYKRKFSNQIKSGDIIGAEIELYKKDNSTINVILNVKTEYDQNGDIIGKHCIFIDVNERRNDRESEVLYKTIINTLPQNIYQLDRNLRIVTANQAFCESYGIKKEDLLGKTLFDIHPKELAKKYYESDKHVINTGETIYAIEKNIIGGKEKWVEIVKTPTKNIKGDITGVLCIFWDISERKIAQETKEVLYEISKTVNTIEDLDEFYKFIHKSMSKLIDTRNFYIALYDESTDLLTFPYFIDDKNEVYEPIKMTGTKSSCEYVIKTKKPFLRTQDICNEMIESGELIQRGSMSKIWLGVPLKIKNKVIGIIVLQSYTDPNLCSEEDVKLMEYVSEQLAIAIETKRTKESLKKSEERYRLLFDNAPIGICLSDKNGNIICANKEMEKITGYSLNELKDINIKDTYVNPEDRKKLLNELENNRSVSDYHVKLKKKNKKIFNAFLNIVTITYREKELFQTICVDITERKKIENTLREKEAYYRSLINDIHEDIIVIDKNYKIIDLNGKVMETTGLSRNEIIGKHCYEVTHNFSKPCHYFGEKCKLIDVFNTGEHYSITQMHKTSDGNYVTVDIILSPVKDEQGNVTYVIEAIRDISDIMRTKNALAKEKEKLALLLKYEQIIADISSVLNTNIYIFKALSNIKEIIKQEAGIDSFRWYFFDNEYYEMFKIYEKNLYKELKDDNSQLYELKKVNWLLDRLKEEEILIVDDVNKFPDAECEYFLQNNIVSCLVIPIKIENQLVGVMCFGMSKRIKWQIEVIKFYKTIVNIISNSFERYYNNYARLEAEKKEVEAVKKAEKASHLASVGILAAGISHEINQPLTALKFKVDGMLHWGKIRPETIAENLEENLTFISEQAQRIDNIIVNVRALVKQEKSQEFVVVNVNDVVKKCVSLLIQRMSAHGIKLITRLTKEKLNILGTETLLEQSIINLLINSYDVLDKYDRSNKKVIISTEKNELDLCMIKVTDNGPGIDEENLENIFEPFFSTKVKPESMGLGLAITRNIINGFNGEITVSNLEEGGVEFIIKLPTVV